MRLLLDTHVYLWCADNNHPHMKKIQNTINSAEKVFVSSASIWEITIKSTLQKIDVDIKKLVETIKLSGFTELPITVAHAATVKELPSHHKDPFDRLLIAQAICEPLIFLTADKLLKNYSDVVQLI